MRAIVTKMDYVGFTFNGIHSSRFGLLSVSSGNRYTKDLLPDFEDYTVDILGGNGSFYFGNKLKNKIFNLSIAYNDITEQEISEIGSWLYNNGEISTLIFDEQPYIKYYVKINSSPSFKYIVFDVDGDRIYKGEATIQFITYEPYGYNVNKFLDEYSEDNISEWQNASKLLASKQISAVDYYDTFNVGEIPIYNPGDVAVDFILTLTVEAEAIPVISLGDSNMTIDIDNLGAGTITIDTQKRLIKHGTTVVNYILTDGDFFKITVDSSLVTPLTVRKMGITNVTGASISYSYKYL